ncbi:epididymal sperm-binding protein 1-like [Polypterus senegalus]|uniref:epididymal sperm-binding protein 1-like n=1 Tax=Polypterus senegalus TaxID=55291 RepID=UPI0019639EFD|nr:epididymal sperm-binding protein 1-like [Polypterus senegalus]
MTDYSSLWCATTSNYDKDFLWTTCSSAKIAGGNAVGASCVFPFIYKGQTYNSCTMTDYSSLWCATTSNYDKDFLWTTCSSVPAVTEKQKAAYCVFPFIYKGHTYNSCTMTDYSSLWCATTSNYDKDFQWTTCSSVPDIDKKAKASSCVFPFIYKGQTYHSCTMTDSSSLWCATTSNYDKDGRLTTCSITGIEASCVFPFVYKGKTYNSCTMTDSSSLWCATTSNYDKDSRWTTCSSVPEVTEKPKTSSCVFPFIYKGQTYNSCTMTDSSTPWCATTSNYDKDGRLTTCSITGIEASCVFPFVYKGKTYNSCTMTDSSSLWCATTSNYDKDSRWTTCSSVPAVTVKSKASSCVFPFIYKGQTYNSCTMTDYSSLWCATTSNYDKDFLWTTCSSQAISNW